MTGEFNFGGDRIPLLPPGDEIVVAAAEEAPVYPARFKPAIRTSIMRAIADGLECNRHYWMRVASLHHLRLTEDLEKNGGLADHEQEAFDELKRILRL